MRQIPLKDIETGLQDWLNFKDIDSNGDATIIKVLIVRPNDLKIIVHPNDHSHFHVISTQHNFNTRFSLESADFINNKVGSISTSDIKKLKHIF